MRRRTRARLALAVPASALVALALLAWHRQQQAHLADRLLPTPPASVTRIALQLPGLPVRHFIRRTTGWQEIGTPSRPADTEQLQVLSDIAAAPVQRWIVAAAVHPRELGLEPPRAVLWLDGTKLAFGDLSPLGPQRYVQLPDGRVALISARYSPYLGTGVDAPGHAGTP